MWILASLLGVVGAFLGLSVLFPGALAGKDAQVHLAYGLSLVAILFSALAITPRLKVRETIKVALTWVAVSLALLTFYRYQDGFRELGREMVFAIDPAEPKTQADEVHIRESLGGHFLAMADIEGTRVRFLVDTGATEVVLTPEDAKRVGIKIKNLDYGTPVATANGMTRVAPIRIPSIRIGSIEVTGVQAAVARDGLDTSLLGMTFLRRLKSFEISSNELVLKQ